LNQSHHIIHNRGKMTHDNGSELALLSHLQDNTQTFTIVSFSMSRIHTE